MDKTKNEEAEFSILGAVLLEQPSLDNIPYIKPEHFTSDIRADLFYHMLKIHAEGKQIDRVSLKTSGCEITGNALAKLIDYVPTASNIGYYANQVKECATRRELIASCEDARKIAINADDVKQAIDEAEASILSVRTENSTKAGTTVQESLKQAFSDIEKRYQNRGQLTGISSGFADIDDMTAGFQNGDLIILAARPSMGKTALVMNIIEHVCKSGKSAQVFSLEMTASQLVQRNIASVGKVESQRMRTGNFNDADWPRMSNASENINKWKLQIEDGYSQTLLDIRAAARRQSRTKQGLDIIVIDYLQLISSHSKEQSREQEVAKMSRSLKQLAKELNIPVIVLAQLNRGLEAREDKRPRNSDLRESGSLEQDADVIIFLHRESYFCADCKKLGADCGKMHYGDAEAIISKQRNGPTGTIDLLWFGELCRFENISKKYK